MNLVIKRKKTHLLHIAFGLIAFIGIQAQSTTGGKIAFLVLTFGAIFLIGTDIYALKKYGGKVMEVEDENLIYTNVETGKLEAVPLNKILGFTHKKQTRFEAGFFAIIVDSSVRVAGQKIAYPNGASVGQDIKIGNGCAETLVQINVINSSISNEKMQKKIASWIQEIKQVS